jgi:ubiquinone biosynthesis protein COQ9
MAARKARGRTNQSADIRGAVLEAALPLILQSGFSDATLKRAAGVAGADTVALARHFPRSSVNLVEAFSDWVDDQMEVALGTAPLSEMKIRERIKAAVNARLVVLRPHKEAGRRAAAFLTLPQNAPVAASLLYRTTDRIWRAVGDTSTDFNFYTKRAILAAVYSSTLLRWFSDDSEDEKATFEFLDARIDDVMRFEKFKAGVSDALARLPSLTDIVGRFSDRRASR